MRKTGYFSVVIIAVFILVSCSQGAPFTSTIQRTESAPVIAESGLDQSTEKSSIDIAPTGTSAKTEQVQSEATSISNPEVTLTTCSGLVTSPNQEGPFYKTGSPERESLIEEGLAGIPILIVGRVFDPDCNALAEIKLDFWLANADGEYDNIGYTLRGHQFTDENGYYSVESIEPTPYTGRPAHIHVKLFAPDGRELLTTQIYFPGSESSPDVLNAPDLLATYLAPDSAGHQKVLFNFIVQD
jgi:protocatechuate 3,4-dioxygenase beta subunit